MYGQNTKKRSQPHYQRQFEVFNISSGTVCTFEDDGYDATNGEPNQARRNALMKLKALDANGDPLFVPKRPLPDHVIKHDRACVDKIAVFREIDDRCRDGDHATLAEKWEANAELRRGFPSRFKKENRTDPLPIVAEQAVAKTAKAKAAKQNKAAAGAVKRQPGKAKAEPAPAEASE